MVYVLSSWWSWYYGMSFGNRAFIDFYCFFAIILAFAFSFKSRIFNYVLILISGVFLFINQVQAFQYKEYILYWNMDKEMYWRVFLKTSTNYKGLLWEEAESLESYNNFADKIKTSEKILEKHIDFENDSSKNIVPTIAHSGTKSFHLNNYAKSSPSIIIKPDFIVNTDRYFLLAEAYIYITDDPIKSNPHLLLTSINGELENICSRGRALNLKTNSWNYIYRYCDINDFGSKNNQIKMYVECNGVKDIYVDDLKLTVYKQRK